MQGGRQISTGCSEGKEYKEYRFFRSQIFLILDTYIELCYGA
jgi:hypothetical protein